MKSFKIGDYFNLNITPSDSYIHNQSINAVGTEIIFSVPINSIIHEKSKIYPITLRCDTNDITEAYKNLILNNYFINKNPIYLDNPWFYKYIYIKNLTPLNALFSYDYTVSGKAPHFGNYSQECIENPNIDILSKPVLIIMFAKKCTKGYSGFMVNIVDSNSFTSFDISSLIWSAAKIYNFNAGTSNMPSGYTSISVP